MLKENKSSFPYASMGQKCTKKKQETFNIICTNVTFCECGAFVDHSRSAETVARELNYPIRINFCATVPDFDVAQKSVSSDA